MIVLQDLTKSELEALLVGIDSRQDAKRARYRARQIFHWVYQRFVFEWDEMTDLAKDLRSWLKENVRIHRLTTKYEGLATDGTRKFLWSLHDSKTVESVLIPVQHANEKNPTYAGRVVGDKAAVDLQDEEAWDSYWDRQTLCISSQVGCAMKCSFCLTGIQGFDRNLATHEIVSQVLEVKRRFGLTNIVFMGMGEPLQNTDAVISACQIFVDQDGMNFSKRKVTVSTSGIVPEIDRLGQAIDVSLAISLNGSSNPGRQSVMPVNKKWPIEELLAACKRYPLGPHRKITFEYVLMAGINDSLEDAERLVVLLKGMRALVNLIPFNPHPGAEYKRPADSVVTDFYHFLIRKGVRATVRISRGQDILAACGQLRSEFGTARGTEKHRDYAVQ